MTKLPREFDTTPERSRFMAGIRSKETGPEVGLRRALWRAGMRGYRKHPVLPGKPDILFPRVYLVVFVDGCFWHSCPLHGHPVRVNTHYWPAKLERTVQRDKMATRRLKSLGYTVLRIWEHDVLPDSTPAVRAVRRALNRLGYWDHRQGKGGTSG